MQTETKIKITDDMQSVLFKMSEGNPGALTALMEILKDGTEIDPQGFVGCKEDANTSKGKPTWLYRK